MATVAVVVAVVTVVVVVDVVVAVVGVVGIIVVVELAGWTKGEQDASLAGLVLRQHLAVTVLFLV